MKRKIVKKFGHSLHVILSTKEFEEGETIRIFHKNELEKEVEKLVEEKISSMEHAY